MRPIDADELWEELRKQDLSYMQQADVIACIKDTIDRRPTVLYPGENNRMQKYLITRNKDTVEVLLMQNENDGTWSYVNVTKGHICPCRFRSADEAVMDMIRLRNKGELVRYERVL